MKQIVIKDNRGTTLAEMIIAFALIGIFITAAATVISSAVMMHSELTEAMYAQSVSEMLLDKVTGELAAARADGGHELLLGDTAKVGGTQGNGALFLDRSGNQVLCLVRDGLLVFSGEQSGDWILDEKAYMGYRISDFQIQKLGNRNILEVSLVIKNLKTGFEYSVSGCTSCYNFATEEEQAFIMKSEIPLKKWE